MPTRGPFGGPRPFGMGPFTKKQFDEPSAQSITTGGHSYRNFDPHEFLAALDNELEQQEMDEGRKEMVGALRFIEDGRFSDFLDAVSEFFFKLDHDEQEMFTRRNPDVVQWMSVRNAVREQNPYDEFFELAEEVLVNDRERVEGDQVPPFTRKDIPEDRSLLESLAFRRRSYRNFAPPEVREVAEQDHTLSRGMARDLDIRTPEIREELDFPVEIRGKEVGRAVLKRIEAGRFNPMLAEAINFFLPLDKDERLSFAARNPGIVEWLSVYGFTQDMPHGDQLFPFSDVEFPLVPTVEE